MQRRRLSLPPLLALDSPLLASIRYHSGRSKAASYSMHRGKCTGPRHSDKYLSLGTPRGKQTWDSFFEAFKNYDESGSPRRTTCLKYLGISKSLLPCRVLLFSILVLANMLMKSGINPFDSQEAKPYKNDVEILAMTNLVTAYQNNDINEFEKILKVSAIEFLHYY